MEATSLQSIIDTKSGFVPFDILNFPPSASSPPEMDSLKGHFISWYHET